MGGGKTILPEEQPTIDFAYACVVALHDIAANQPLTEENIWVKRPGTGEIKAIHFQTLLGKTAQNHIAKDSQLRWADIQ